jgi:predicted PurR-regulated permease PerM
VFLCAIVFVCSFIPVLGVVLSSIPIAIVALVQRDGSMFLALQAIAGILVIHFIETSLLNPKILGDMLHLHPVAVLAVLAIGEHFFGVWGLLLGVPIAVYIFRCVILNESIPGLIETEPFRDDDRPPDTGGGKLLIDPSGDAKRREAVGAGAPSGPQP